MVVPWRDDCIECLVWLLGDWPMSLRAISMLCELLSTYYQSYSPPTINDVWSWVIRTKFVSSAQRRTSSPPPCSLVRACCFPKQQVGMRSTMACEKVICLTAIQSRKAIRMDRGIMDSIRASRDLMNIHHVNGHNLYIKQSSSMEPLHRDPLPSRSAQ